MVNWRDWLELLFRNLDVLTFVAVVFGFTATLILLRKLFAPVQIEIRSCAGETTRLINEVKSAAAAFSEVQNRLEAQLSALRQEVTDCSDKQHSKYEAIRNELREEIDRGRGFDSRDERSDGGDDGQSTEFPSSVQSYLGYVDEKKLTTTVAKSDVLRAGNLVPSLNGQFIIVSGGHNDIAVPQVARFSSNEEFGMYYGDYFQCDAPASGEVWVVRPAIVRTDEYAGGWQVVTKGQIEVK